jgi:hypothetical protein
MIFLADRERHMKRMRVADQTHSAKEGLMISPGYGLNYSLAINLSTDSASR